MGAVLIPKDWKEGGGKVPQVFVQRFKDSSDIPYESITVEANKYRWLIWKAERLFNRARKRANKVLRALRR